MTLAGVQGAPFPGSREAAVETTIARAPGSLGLSCVVDPFGEIVAGAGEAPLETLTAEVDLDRCSEAADLLDRRRDRRPDLYGAIAREEPAIRPGALAPAPHGPG